MYYLYIMTFITSGSIVSSNNASTSNLSGDATYTGTGEEVTKYSSILINIKASHNSTEGGVSVEFSQDNTNWDIKYISTYYATGNKALIYDIQAKFFRIVYTNGSTTQTTFRLQAIININKHGSENVPQIMRYEDATYDAFNRFRVSNPHTLFQISHTMGKGLEMTEKTSNGGTSTHQANESCVDMAVTTTGSSEVTRQTRPYISYQPGKSLLITLTGVINANSNGTDCRSRIGYFDDNNGIYFEYTGGTIYVVRRSKVTGSVVNTSVAQTSWNIDPLDGTGYSGINLDASKSHIYMIDLQWLGVGRVRCGFNINGKTCYIHEFLHANIQTTTYMTQATLPIRYQITNTGTTNGAGTLKMICSAAVSEGGYEAHGEIFSIGLVDDEEVSVGVSAFIPIISIRLKSANSRIPIKLVNASILSTSNDNITYQILQYHGPTSDPLTSASWTSVNDDSAVEYDKSATAIDTSNAYALYHGFTSNNVDLDTTKFSSPHMSLYADIDNNVDMICLVCRKVGSGTANILGSLQWNEFHY